MKLTLRESETATRHSSGVGSSCWLNTQLLEVISVIFVAYAKAF